MGQSHADGPNAWASPTSRSSHFTPRTPATTRPSASRLASCSRLLRRGGGVRIVVLLRLGTRPRLLASGLDLLVPRNPRSQSTTPWFQSNIRDPDLTTRPVAKISHTYPVLGRDCGFDQVWRRHGPRTAATAFKSHGRTDSYVLLSAAANRFVSITSFVRFSVILVRTLSVCYCAKRRPKWVAHRIHNHPIYHHHGTCPPWKSKCWPDFSGVSDATTFRTPSTPTDTGSGA